MYQDQTGQAVCKPIPLHNLTSKQLREMYNLLGGCVDETR